MEIIPDVNCPDTECARVKLAQIALMFKASGYARRRSVHMDVTDGVYTTHRAFSDLKALKDLREIVPGAGFEMHLMVDRPEAAAPQWLQNGADRVIIHPERSPEKTILDLLRKYGDRVALSTQPDTEPEVLLPFFNDALRIQVLAVRPGPSHQEMDARTRDRIVRVREMYKRAWIEVDGGVTEENLRDLAVLGVDAVAVASALFSSPDPVYSYTRFVQLSAHD